MEEYENVTMKEDELVVDETTEAEIDNLGNMTKDDLDNVIDEGGTSSWDWEQY